MGLINLGEGGLIYNGVYLMGIDLFLGGFLRLATQKGYERDELNFCFLQMQLFDSRSSSLFVLLMW